MKLDELHLGLDRAIRRGHREKVFRIQRLICVFDVTRAQKEERRALRVKRRAEERRANEGWKERQDAANASRGKAATVDCQVRKMLLNSVFGKFGGNDAMPLYVDTDSCGTTEPSPVGMSGAGVGGTFEPLPQPHGARSLPVTADYQRSRV